MLPLTALAADTVLGQGLLTGGIDVRDFGAKGDGIADDTQALQAAIDRAIKERKVLVRLPTGRYRTRDTLHLGYGDAYTTLALVGEATASFGGNTAGTIILPDMIDRPTLNIQGARKTVVRGIAIRGRNFDFAREKANSKGGRAQNYAGVGDPDPAAWLDPSLSDGLRPFAPYAAITIDAYSAAPRADSYPPPPTTELGGGRDSGRKGAD
jgi:hypothetical protein